MPSRAGMRLWQELPRDFTLRTGRKAGKRVIERDFKRGGLFEGTVFASTRPGPGQDYAATHEEMKRYADQKLSKEGVCRLPWISEDTVVPLQTRIRCCRATESLQVSLDLGGVAGVGDARDCFGGATGCGTFTEGCFGQRSGQDAVPGRFRSTGRSGRWRGEAHASNTCRTGPAPGHGVGAASILRGLALCDLDGTGKRVRGVTFATSICLHYVTPRSSCQELSTLSWPDDFFRPHAACRFNRMEACRSFHNVTHKRLSELEPAPPIPLPAGYTPDYGPYRARAEGDGGGSQSLNGQPSPRVTGSCLLAKAEQTVRRR